MPVASLNDSFSRPWACTTNKTFALHFQSKYPPGFSTSFEAYNASPNSLDLTDIAEVDTYSVSGALASRALEFAKRMTQDSFALHFGDLDPVGSDPLFDVYYLHVPHLYCSDQLYGYGHLVGHVPRNVTVVVHARATVSLGMYRVRCKRCTGTAGD